MHSSNKTTSSTDGRKATIQQAVGTLKSSLKKKKGSLMTAHTLQFELYCFKAYELLYIQNVVNTNHLLLVMLWTQYAIEINFVPCSVDECIIFDTF